ncbi:MAG: RNA methyltransferase, partial [Desulfobacula sp.]|nr:RNA methyltransferase [Desulfobacula sp.]
MNAFEKRLKRRVTGREHPFFAVCPPGLTAFCKNEILATGFDPDKLAITRGGVEFNCKPDTCMQLNLKLGSPSRILMRISQFKADNFGKFEKKMAGIEWELFLPENCSPNFKVTTKKSALYHSDAIALRSETILRQKSGLGEKKNIRQNQNTAQTIFIRADHDHFTISLDTSGDLLFKRGIKKQVSQAPLRETLAFAMLTWANFSAKDILIDPIFGSVPFSLEGSM